MRVLKPRSAVEAIPSVGPIPPQRRSCRVAKPVAFALLAILAAGMGSPAQAQDLVRLLIHGLQWLQVSQLNDAQEVSLGRQIDQQLKARGQIRVSSNFYWVERVNRIGQRVAAHSERPNLPYTFQVVEDPDINAFATMGGFVYITTGAAPKDLCNAEQSRTLPSIAAFFLLQRPMTSGRVHPYHPARGISTGVTSPRA